ncbi:MAG: NirA family protein [Planctomycetota bacterium]|nr:NirA family protein [Planctomycetota bacterium]
MSESIDFSEEQKHYLAGLAAGMKFKLAQPAGEPALPSPDDLALKAQARVLAEGRKLSPEEEAKRTRPPLEAYGDIREHASQGRAPKGMDVFRFKYFGLFHVAPTQDSFMCRLRIPGGILNAHQLKGLAGASELYAGSYADVTTRANLQLREIRPEHALKLLSALAELGIVTKGSGADNIRNVTGSPTAGIDPQELLDTRPLTRELHEFILNNRSMYGLPRKFNVAFDGGGVISALEDTNDIGFAAVRVPEGRSAPAGVYFRVLLAGITGHKDFARDAGVLIRPEEAIETAAALIRVYIENGDRTDRRKARLKYLLDAWGMERYLQETQKLLKRPWRHVPLEACEPRGTVHKHAHIGVHKQVQKGMFYAGVLLPVGRMNAAQMRGIADLSERFGSGTIRLTVWQNLLISDIPSISVPKVRAGLEALGLSCVATNIRGALVACTGNEGCKYAASATKKHALALAQYLEGKVEIDQPMNIHFTGCHHSCAQHYIGDIGLLGTKVELRGEMVEGYHVHVGGGYGAHRSIAREVLQGVPFDELPRKIERICKTYMERRAHNRETFAEFTNRHSLEDLRSFFTNEPSVTPAAR